NIIYRLGVSRQTSLGFELTAAFRARPKIEDQPLAYVFRPFRGDQRLTTFSAGRLVFGVTDGRYRCHGDLPWSSFDFLVRGYRKYKYCFRAMTAQWRAVYNS